MSHYQKRKRKIFLLSKLTLLDYLLILGALFFLFLVFFVLLSPSPNSQPLSARSVQTTNNINLLWAKNEYIVPRVGSESSLFFVRENQCLISPIADVSNNTFALEALDMVSGQMIWQSAIPSPAKIRINDGQFFILTSDWLDEAPSLNNQDFGDCNWREKYSSLSTYDVKTGQKNWGFGYREIYGGSIDFTERNVYLHGSRDHGTQRLEVHVDKNSGFIIGQYCTQPALAQTPPTFPGEDSSTFYPRAIDDDQDDRGCSPDKRFCFFTEGNRLHIQKGNSGQSLAYIDFEGAELVSYDMHVVVQDFSTRQES